jgi:hypothetical protein
MVVRIDIVPGYSTTNILEKIRALNPSSDVTPAK